MLTKGPFKNSLISAFASDDSAVVQSIASQQHCPAMPCLLYVLYISYRPHVSMSDWCYQSLCESCCVVRAGGPQEISQKACASSQAQGRDRHEQEGLLHQVIPQVIRHVDCEVWYIYMYNQYKANVCLSGQKVHEMSDFSLQELKERLWKRIGDLNATSHTLLTKAVLRTWEPCAWDSEVEAVQI